MKKLMLKELIYSALKEAVRISIVGGFIVSIPSSLGGLDFRGTASSIIFNFNKIEPPFAALEDSRQQDEEQSQDEFEELNETGLVQGPSINLVAGSDFNPDVLKDTKETKESNSRMLAGIQLKSQSRKSLKSELEKQQVVALDNIRFKEPVLIGDNGELLPIKERKSRLESVIERSVLATESPSQRAERLVAAIKHDNGQNDIGQGTKVIPTQSGAPIIIKKSEQPKTALASSGNVEKQGIKANQEDSEFNQEDQQAIVDLPYAIEGQIEITGGLAYTGVDTFMRVVQVQGGYVREEGLIWPRDGRFEIIVDKVEGYLVGELRRSNGEILGYGELDLNHKIVKDKNEYRISGLLLKINPAPQGLMVNVSSARSFENNKIEIDDAKVVIDSIQRQVPVDKDGQYRDETIDSSSSYIVRAEKKGYWGSIAVHEASQAQEVQLFPQEMIEALIALNLEGVDDANLEQFGVVWGTVLSEGKPVDGAAVEMAGDSYVGPIYFSGYVPDKSLETTSKNGLFAFIKVHSGPQTIRARKHGRVFPTEVFPVTPKHVSNVDIKEVRPRKTSVRVFDGIKPDKYLESTISVLGSRTQFQVSKRESQDLELPGGKGIMILEADAGEPYEVVRVTKNKTAKELEFPMIGRSWLKRIAEDAKVLVDPEQGTFVGFNRGVAKDIFIDQGSTGENLQIVFFDKEGVMVPGAKEIPEEGGVVVFNIAPGYRTITTVSDSGRTKTEVIIASPGVINTTVHLN